MNWALGWWRLARHVGIKNLECRCTPCMVALVEALARELENPRWEQSKSG